MQNRNREQAKSRIVSRSQRYEFTARRDDADAMSGSCNPPIAILIDGLLHTHEGGAQRPVDGGAVDTFLFDVCPHTPPGKNEFVS